jgi:glutathione S-transferase
VTEGGTPVLCGAGYSVYTRIARLAFEEKGVPYRLVETDVFAAEGPPAKHLERRSCRAIRGSQGGGRG